MAKRKTLEEDINCFLDEWGYEEFTSFMEDVVPLFELYDVDEKEDWVKEKIGGDVENTRTVRLIRTVYLMSRIADFHAGKLCKLNVTFSRLWQKMEKQGLGQKESK